MRIEYFCIVTLEERDVRLAAANGGITIDHPIPPVRTVIKLTNEVREQLEPKQP